MEATLVTPPLATPESLATAPASQADGLNPEPPTAGGAAPMAVKTPAVQIVLVVIGGMAFLYFARPVMLPIFLACIAAMTLRPLIRWFACYHVAPSVSAAIVLGFLVVALGVGFFQLGRPALTWMNEAPQHMTELRQRFQTIFPRLAHFNQAAAAVTDLGATEAEKKA